ncbi:MAG: YihY/virulence factor BrkB family protein, partial [Marmoricola sp.]
LLVWAAASTGFAFYVANFGSYNKTYGSVAGAIVALLWLWLTNVALLFGAEVDAVRDGRIAEEKAARAAAAADLDSLDPVSYLAPPRSLAAPRPEPERSEKLVLRESFPVRPGQPPYGPVTQPVPEED